jgi:hypothetical protein
VNSLLIISGVAPFRAQPFDTGNIYGELTVNLLGCFAEFETSGSGRGKSGLIANTLKKGRGDF